MALQSRTLVSSVILFVLPSFKRRYESPSPPVGAQAQDCYLKLISHRHFPSSTNQVEEPSVQEHTSEPNQGALVLRPSSSLRSHLHYNTTPFQTNLVVRRSAQRESRSCTSTHQSLLRQDKECSSEHSNLNTSRFLKHYYLLLSTRTILTDDQNLSQS